MATNGTRSTNRHRLPVFAAFIISAVTLAAQAPSTLGAELRRIFQDNEYVADVFGPAAWFDGGAAYTTVEPSPTVSGARDIVQYHTASGRRSVLVASDALKPPGAAAPLSIDGYSWSADRRRLLLFTNSRRVWRQNTRGDYWLLERASGGLRKLGGAAPPSSLMFAKFSPDGSRVAYVRDRDIYVEDVASTKPPKRLTTAGSEQIINGTSDWVYEEELDLRDAFRWSPDSRRIAYWHFDTSGVGRFTLINDTDALYPTLTVIPYPKAGTTNSEVRIGVVDASGGKTQWMQTPGDPRNTYLARLEWSEDSRSLAIQQLNRLQNTNDVLLADARSGSVRRVHRDESKAWVEVVDDFAWLNRGREFLWLSEKDGWRHVYRIAVDGGRERLVTRFEGDVIGVAGMDARSEWLYFTASPESAVEQQLYRWKLDGDGKIVRVTPDTPGFHTYTVSPDARWAFHTHSRIDRAPVVDLVSLPDHRVVRTLVENATLQAKVKPRMSPPTEFFTIDIGGGVSLDGWMIKPRAFDPRRKYPVLVYVYGEPAGQTVLDRWFSSRMLFHRAIADEGYVVVSVDNRGTPAPRGAAWRKIVYGTVGDLSSREQAMAIQALAARYPFIDGRRVAVWGWSGGGSNTLNAMFRYPDVFKVGVSVAPVPDQRLYDTIYQERYMGLPQENVEGYRIGSPINFAEGLKGDLLVMHGSGDDNVHYQGTERLVNRLVELGKPFDLVVYPNRSHSISEGPGTLFHVHSSIARFLIEHMPPSNATRD